jgi:hypothetical protein
MRTLKVIIDEGNFHAIYRGYLSSMGNILTAIEKKHFIYAGKYMIYMQAIRFITDFLNGDTYYQVTYSGQNLVRAQNQLTLLHQFSKLEPNFQNLKENY